MKNKIEVFEEDVSVDESVIHLIERAADCAFSSERRRGNLTVLLVSEERIRELNRSFRSIDRVTDVLTFPADDFGTENYSGDIAICVKRALEQSEEYGHSVEREFAFLTVHGCLHLMGYDHIVKDDETIMLRRQKEILNEMGLTEMSIIDHEEIARMLEMAEEAMSHSYSIYSGFKVGACLKTKSGKYYLGCNIENAAYSPTICAERTALFKAVYDGERNFDSIAIICSGDGYSYPCGVCRQVLSEFCDPDMPIISSNCRKEYTVYPLGKLLPNSFGPKDLEK